MLFGVPESVPKCRPEERNRASRVFTKALETTQFLRKSNGSVEMLEGDPEIPVHNRWIFSSFPEFPDT